MKPEANFFPNKQTHKQIHTHGIYDSHLNEIGLILLKVCIAFEMQTKSSDESCVALLKAENLWMKTVWGAATIEPKEKNKNKKLKRFVCVLFFTFEMFDIMNDAKPHQKFFVVVPSKTVVHWICIYIENIFESSPSRKNNKIE